MTAQIIDLNGHPVSFREGSHWYCARTNMRSEYRAVQSLKECGYETFLPMAKKWIRHARVKKERAFPLFPRYLFTRIDPNIQGFWAIKHCRGIECLLSNNGVPQSISDQLIEDLRSAQDIGVFDETTAVLRMQVGDEVRAVKGQFSGFIGTLKNASDKKRVELLMTFFGRAVIVKMPLAWVRPA